MAGSRRAEAGNTRQSPRQAGAVEAFPEGDSVRRQATRVQQVFLLSSLAKALCQAHSCLLAPIEKVCDSKAAVGFRLAEMLSRCQMLWEVVGHT